MAAKKRAGACSGDHFDFIERIDRDARKIREMQAEIDRLTSYEEKFHELCGAVPDVDQLLRDLLAERTKAREDILVLQATNASYWRNLEACRAQIAALIASRGGGR